LGVYRVYATKYRTMRLGRRAKLGVSAFILMILISSCRKEKDFFEVTIDRGEVAVLVQSSLKGKVLDENGDGVPGTFVLAGGRSSTTNNKGEFSFNDIPVEKSNDVITAEKSGYFQGIANSDFQSGGGSYVEITMLSKGVGEIVNATLDQELSIGDDVTLNIPSNSLVDADGNKFNGNAEVFTKYLDPTGDGFYDKIPGELSSKDEAGMEVMLEPYGILAIEVSSENEILMLDEGEKMEIVFDIPDALQDDAPDELTVYLYDLEEERWYAVDSCNKSGSTYVCSVGSCSGYICIANPVEAVCLSGTFMNSDGSFASYLKVEVEDLSNGFKYFGYTDVFGFICGSVPAGVDLRITIKDLCDNIIYTEDLGPLNMDFDFGTLTVEVFEFVLTVLGEVSKCDGQNLESGYIEVSYPGNTRFFEVVDGLVNEEMGLKCIEFPVLNILAYSDEEQMVSDTIKFTEFEDINLGQVLICNELTEYFNLTVDGTEYWTSPVDFYEKENETTNWWIVEGMAFEREFKIDIEEYDGLGSYASHVSLTSSTESLLPVIPSLISEAPDILLEILVDDANYIEGTITGTATDENSLSVTIDGSFKIKKTN